MNNKKIKVLRKLEVFFKKNSVCKVLEKIA